MRRIANPLYAARRSGARLAAAGRQPRTSADAGALAAAVDWTGGPRWYVVAETGDRSIWLAGPFRTRGEAAQVAARAVIWAVHHGGGEQARRYRYLLHRHADGQVPSVLGRLSR